MGIETKETSKSPFGIVLTYILFGAAWILFSDMALALVIHDAMTGTVVSTLKGLAFVAVTAALLYVLIDRKIKALSEADRRREEAERLRAIETEEREIAVGFLHLVNQSGNKQEMIREAVSFFQRQSGCEAVGIRLKEGEDYPYFEARGFSREFVLAEDRLCVPDGAESENCGSVDNPVLACMCGNVIRGSFDPSKPFFSARGSFWTNCTTDLLAGTTEADRLARTRNRCNGEGYESVALIALRVGDERLGLLQLNDRRKGRFSVETITLWERLAGYLAVALAKFQAEESLRESVNQYRLLFENMLEGVAHCRMLFDDAGRPIDFVYLHVNSAFGRLTGLGNVAGKRVTEVIPGIKESHPELLDIYGRVALTGRPEKFELEFNPLGRWFSLSVYSTEKEHFVAVFENITDRKHAEARLDRERSFLKTLVRTIPDLVWLKDPDGVYLACNPTFERFFGAGEEDIVGKTDYDFLSAEEAEFFRGKDREAMAAGRARVNEEWITFADDGSHALLETIKTPMLDAQGGLIGVLGVARNITGMHEAQAALRESEARFRALVEQAADALFVHDFNGRFFDVNQRACESLGYTREELLRMCVMDVEQDFDLASAQQAWAQVESGRATTVYGHQRRKDGAVFPVEARLGCLDIQGRRLILGLVRDITDRKRAEEERERAERLESLGLLAGGIAHDFNNILTAILGNISLARIQAGEGHQAEERLASCEKALGRAMELTRQLLTFARGGEPVKGAVDTERLIREVVSFALRGSNSKAELVLQEGLRHLHADAGQVHQALNNLIINACQAMPGGGTITVNAVNEKIGSGDEKKLPVGGYVKITVSDEGCGISPEVVAKIFDPYFTTKPAGTGLGLTSAFSIVNRHDGAIRVSSTPGRGTTFTVLLPAADDSTGTEAVMTERPRSADVQGRSVLVMDDEEMIRTLLVDILEELGYSAVTCADGAEAVSLYNRALGKGERFAAVILDMTIPGGMGGKQAGALIRACDPDAVLIISSGYTVDPVCAGETEPIFRGVVSKPYNVNQLAQELARLVQA